MDEAILCLRKIEKFQEKEIKEKGSGKAQKFCIIFDDVVGHVKLMNSPEFIGSFIKVTLHTTNTHPTLHTHFRRGISTSACFSAVNISKEFLVSADYSQVICASLRCQIQNAKCSAKNSPRRPCEKRRSFA